MLVLVRLLGGGLAGVTAASVTYNLPIGGCSNSPGDTENHQVFQGHLSYVVYNL